MFLHLWVILFTRRGVGGPCPGGSLSMGCLCPRESLSRETLSRGVSVEVGSLSRGCLSGGGLCQADPPYGNMREVRILLECILVDISVFRTRDEMGGEFTSSVQVKLTPFQLHPL